MTRVLLLLTLVVIALSVACSSSLGSEPEIGYIVETVELGDGVEILNYYQVDRTLGIRGLVADKQELHAKGNRLRLDDYHSSIETVDVQGEDVFLLLSGNFGRFVARLCQGGSIEYVCSVPFDYLGMDFGLIWSLDVVPGDDNTITSTVYYGCPGEYCCKEPECEKLAVSVSVFDFGISSSCIPALHSGARSAVP